MGFSVHMLFAAIFLVMVLMANTGNLGPAGVEGRMCKGPSRTFKGICISDRNCASVCEREGFHDGECEGFRKRCLCKRVC